MGNEPERHSLHSSSMTTLLQAVHSHGTEVLEYGSAFALEPGAGEANAGRAPQKPPVLQGGPERLQHRNGLHVQKPDDDWEYVGFETYQRWGKPLHRGCPNHRAEAERHSPAGYTIDSNITC